LFFERARLQKPYVTGRAAAYTDDGRESQLSPEESRIAAAKRKN
jgi:hypothetical protein